MNSCRSAPSIPNTSSRRASSCDTSSRPRGSLDASNEKAVMQQLTRQQIAWRVAQDIPEGSYVNLGSGMPLMVSDYVPAGREIIFHSENGLLGIGPRQTGE